MSEQFEKFLDQPASNGMILCTALTYIIVRSIINAISSETAVKPIINQLETIISLLRKNNN